MVSSLQASRVQASPSRPTAADANVIIITDPTDPVDILRKTQLLVSVLAMYPGGTVLPQPNPGSAPLLIVYDNTFQGLGIPARTVREAHLGKRRMTWDADPGLPLRGG